MISCPIHIVRCALASLLIAGFLAGCPRFQFSPNVAITRALVYGLGYVQDGEPGSYRLKDLLFDLLEPTDIPDSNRPAILMIHGGGFDGGSREQDDLVAYADALASEGYVCFLMDYRLQGDRPPAPDGFNETELIRAVHAAFVDAKVAIRHIRANSAAYGINPNRIAVFGESAGAFAALAAGVSDATDFLNDGSALPVPEENNLLTDPRPQAVIDFWGSADPVLDEFDGTDPPILVVHGLLDQNLGTTYIPSVTNIASACDFYGVDCRFVTLVTAGHGAWDETFEGQTLAELSLDYLREVL